MHDVQSAEEKRRKHAHIGPPHRKDDQRDREPAAVAEGVVGPDARGIVHDIVQSAEPGDHRADAGGGVFVAADIDARGVRRVGVFSHGAQVQARPGMPQHIGRGQGDDDGQIGQKTVGEEELSEPAQPV